MGSSGAAPFLSQLRDYRARTLEVLRRSVPDGSPHLYGIIRETIELAGKGLRPAVCLAACGAYGGRIEDALDSAAAIELLHNAFLVHDDVEDLSETRHGLPTVHMRHGVPLAVNTGDAMQALSMRMLRGNVRTLGPAMAFRIFDEFDHLLLRSLEGQAMELGWIRDNNMSLKIDDYVRMVSLKTCWYSFIHPCRIGALIASRGTADLGVFNEFGFYLGSAFQIHDDILNLAGTDVYGKEAAGDLYEGKRTLMLMHLLESAQIFDRIRILEIFSKPRQSRLPKEVAWLQELMQRQGSIDYARAAARDFLAAAQRAFDQAYGRCPDNVHKDFLRGLMEYVVARDR